MVSNPPTRIMVDYALMYAQRELRVFPLQSICEGRCSCGKEECASAGKHPRTKNGMKDATSERGQIQQWWARWPEANIGIATGKGLYVIDIDCSKGASYENLEELGVRGLNWTLTARTGSGGYHLYLLCNEPLGNTTNKLAPYIDTRGEGGYVVAPPSRNIHGGYSWYSGSAMQYVPAGVIARHKGPKQPFAGPLQLYPGHEIEQEKKKPLITHPSSEVVPASTPVVSASVAGEARNNYLVSMAGRLRGHGLGSHEICALLSALNQARYGAGRHPQGPLALEELERTIFKSVEKWEQTCGVLANTVPVVDSLPNLMSQTIEEPLWLVPGLLSEGLALLAGKPKLGKSWLALALALTCALGSSEQGGLVLGRYEVEPVGVLYLSLEDSQSRFQSRVTKLLNGRPVPENFGYALSWQPLLAQGLLDLETALSSAPNPRLVVIDTLARVRTPGSGSGSMYQEDYALMAALHELTVRHHIALILVHHTRKMPSSDTFDEISGSTGLTGAADTSMVLKRERGQSNAILHITGRDVEEQELALDFNASDCTWTATGSAADREISRSRQEVLNLLAEKGEAMTPAEVAKALEKPRNTIKSLLRRMEKEGVLSSDQAGSYGLNDELSAEE